MSAPITLTGRLTKDPECRYSATGMAVANFTVVTSRRTKVDDKWTDVDVTYWTVSAFRQLAENVRDSLHKGDAVVVVGKMKSRKYEAKDGTNRTVWEVNADHVAADLVKNSVTINGVQRSNASDAPAEPDPWSTNPFVPDDAEIPF